MAHLVHGCEVRGAQYRIVADGDVRVLERADRDALGDLSWQRIERYSVLWGITGATATANIQIVLAILDDLATKREAVAKTYDYSTGDGVNGGT